MLFGLKAALTLRALFDSNFGKRMQEKNFTAEIRTKDNSVIREFRFGRSENILKDKSNKLQRTSTDKPDVSLIFKDAATAVWLMLRNSNLPIQIHAMKNFLIEVEGADEFSIYFMQTLAKLTKFGSEKDFGIALSNGVKRYTSNTNGGPVFVYVKDDKIIRITPIEFDETDGRSWTIKARGREFTPPRKGSVNPYTLSLKSLIYSPDRLLYPMKRVDFDPNGNRNCQNRGISGYERISWDEALDIVANEIKRVKTTYGPGSIMNGSGSHHTWGNLGYWLSTRNRFMNSIGYCPVVHNPDSWEGWYWGAIHHWGNSMRNGASDTYGTIEDCLKECEMIVFWSSDPESTSGVYGAFEGTIRRQWAKELGIKMVHIDPFYNHTAALLGGKWLAPRADTGNAMSLAIAYIWITEELYDKDYVEKRTHGFEKWRDYILGKEDGIVKTPEWQEKETDVPAKDVRALAREWGTKKTYLSAGGLAGFGGACRCATGIEWARSMVCLMAMQGLGKPGVNMGGLQQGTPVDTHFFFPGYAEGGLSGDLDGTALRVNLYQRMPQLPTMNTVTQLIPRLRIPEVFLDGHCEGYPTDPKTIEGQFKKFAYPAPGYSPVKMYYKYGGSHFGTMPDSNRYVKAYRSENLEFVVNQAIWFEGETKFADIILPACTNFERYDIGETANSGGYSHHQFTQWNHRVITFQHRCIKPLGESKSDYQIFLELAQRLDLGAPFSEGKTELEWCRRLFDASDLPTVISWKKFIKKGYYVVPAPDEALRSPVSWRWFAEGRKKDVPELAPLPSDYSGKWREGLQTQTGRLEFDSSSLKRYSPDDPERATISKYVRSWEGHHCTEIVEKFPLQMISPHPRYSFHTMFDAKDGFINDVKDHRVLVDGHYYWIVKINSKDAKSRNIRHHDLVEVFNDRGSVICAADVTERLLPGTVLSCEGSAQYDPIINSEGRSGIKDDKDNINGFERDIEGFRVKVDRPPTDRGGCINMLTPSRNIIKSSHSSAPNSCLVEIRLWKDNFSNNHKAIKAIPEDLHEGIVSAYVEEVH
ncbi:MAG: molybdopterin-dependent oxidoreductase [Desulfamplus sp.]|nr:molybdopterin-dependent oxidoreductase [Desulfamplus sp.]